MFTLPGIQNSQMPQTPSRKMRPAGIVTATVLLHLLNVASFIFVCWGDPGSIPMAALFGIYVLFTGLVIHALWKGENWARWLILIRCVYMLASVKLLLIMGGVHLLQGFVERVVAVVLIVYLNLPGVRAWFRGVGHTANEKVTG